VAGAGYAVAAVTLSALRVACLCVLAISFGASLLYQHTTAMQLQHSYSQHRSTRQ